MTIVPGMKVRLITRTPLERVGTVLEVGKDGFFCVVTFSGVEVGVETSKLIPLNEEE